MIFDFLLIIFIQPLTSYIFIFLSPILIDFFSDNLKSFKLKIFILPFMADLIFIKPLGFFLIITSFSFLILFLLAKIFPSFSFGQIFIFMLVFNFLFIILFMIWENITITPFLLLKIVFLNIFFQFFYFLAISFFGNDRRRFNFSTKW